MNDLKGQTGETRGDEKNDRQTTETSVPALTEITPAMIEAGVKRFRQWESGDEWDARRLVREIYESMAREAAKASHR